MGWVVYEAAGGRAIKYYRKESVAKSQVTRNNRMIDSANLLRSQLGISYHTSDRHWLCCSYADYEGVLMGMQEPERKMWAFCRG